MYAKPSPGPWARWRTETVMTLTPITATVGVDHRLAFLRRAAAALARVEAGELTPAEAFDGLMSSVRYCCQCDRELIARWERDFPYRPDRRP
jgi:hypothetical protein